MIGEELKIILMLTRSAKMLLIVKNRIYANLVIIRSNNYIMLIGFLNSK